MSPRTLFFLPLLGLAGCSSAPDTSTTSPAVAPLASLPRHKHLAEVRAAGAAELLRPAPSLSDLTQGGTARFSPPPAGSPPANYLTSFNDPRPKRGLVVCEPQGTQAKNFGAGCARWMSALGAGSTAFEVVPTWGMAGGFLHSKKWESMNLERGRAVQLARGLDASHVAVGSFDGRKLRYELIDVRKFPSTVIGTYEIHGSPAQIVSDLPRLTRQIVQATGAQGAIIPARVGMSADDLAFLGSLSYDTEHLLELKPSLLTRVARLASHPLGALYVGRTQITSRPIRVQAARTLLAVAPTNALLAEEVAQRFAGIEKQKRTEVLQALDRKFSRNESIAMGSAELRREEEDYFAEVHYYETAARIAPHSSVAWYYLADALTSQADQERQGAVWSQMNRGQASYVEQIYPRAQAAAWKAVSLEPNESAYWLALSSTSTMNSNAAWACDALTQSLKYDPENEDALNWGIEIFQPKWFGNPTSFATMARLAVDHAGRGHLDADGLCTGLIYTDQQMLKRPLLQKLVSKEPNNAPALRQYSNAVRMELGDYKAALPYARRAVRLAPNDAQALSELADIEQHDLGQYEESIKLFQRAIKLEPKNPLHWVNMALSYAKWGKIDEARKYALKGQALGYRGPHPVWNMVGLKPAANSRDFIDPKAIQQMIH